MNTLVELCAGSAALTLHCQGMRPPLAYMGGKGSYAPQIWSLLGLGFTAPSTFELYDRGEWGHTLETLFSLGAALPVLAEQAALALGTTLPVREASFSSEAPFFSESVGVSGHHGAHAVASVILAWKDEDARDLFDRLRSSPPNKNPIIRAATHLYLQTRTYRGKPVYPRADGSGWVTHGFDAEVRGASRPGAKPRGAYNERPKFALKIKALADLKAITATCCDARSVAPVSDSTVYIDPDYVGTTGYEHSLPREAVCALAEAHASVARVVAISEAEPLRELGPGWMYHRLADHRSSRSFVAGESVASVGEWLTVRRSK